VFFITGSLYLTLRIMVPFFRLMAQPRRSFLKFLGSTQPCVVSGS
jgi:hypothetical protein